MISVYLCMHTNLVPGIDSHGDVESLTDLSPLKVVDHVFIKGVANLLHTLVQLLFRNSLLLCGEVEARLRDEAGDGPAADDMEELVVGRDHHVRHRFPRL